MADRLRWGILGTGAIVQRFASELTTSRTGVLTAIASRSLNTATEFAGTHGARHAHGDYQALLEDDEVDVVYIATPHPDHGHWAVRAAREGKHILCEKPLTIHQADAEVVIESARANGVFLMEAFMYRCHPQTRRVLELVRSGVIGELRVIEAFHSFQGSTDIQGRLLNPDLGGGGILDVGCYCMSAARLMAGVSLGNAGPVEPIEVDGYAQIGAASKVDEWALGVMKLPNGILAQLACGVQLNAGPALRLHGSDATLEVSEPWLPGLDGKRVHEIFVIRPSGGERVTVESDRGLYAIEADHVAACIERGAVESPDMTWADTLGNMAALDRWRRAVGVSYPVERPSALRVPIDGGPVAVRQSLPQRPITGVPIPASRIVLGTMLALGDETWPTAMSVFDHFFERGGNCFDTARRYGNGESDRAIGHWMDTRGVRSQVVLIAKGAHTPHCDPETVNRELDESLHDLRAEYVDLYLLHRDNPKLPVGEFVDVLNEHHRAGRIRAFGGSNWTAERVDEANRYARENGLVGFTALSNQFSLARMVRPTFPGCLDAAGEEWRMWLVRTGMPVVAWSSQAAGFFAAGDDAPTARAWREAGNFSRRERARQLAARRGVPATTIALAWVLAQPLPIFPIIGPRTLGELVSSLAADQISLSPAELAWLDLQDDTED